MIVEFDSTFWTDPDFLSLSLPARALFVYLWTNDHKNSICMYQLSMAVIKTETGLERAEVLALLAALGPKVRYDESVNLFWVPGHVKHQFMRTGNISPKMIPNFKKALISVPTGHPFIGEFLDRYASLGITYPFPIRGQEPPKGVTGIPITEGRQVETEQPQQVEPEKQASGRRVDKFQDTRNDIIRYLNAILGSDFSLTTKSTVEHINARLAEGFTLEDFKTVITDKVAEWTGDPKFSKFLRPQTLFSPKFESYLQAARRPKPRTVPKCLEGVAAWAQEIQEEENAAEGQEGVCGLDGEALPGARQGCKPGTVQALLV